MGAEVLYHILPNSLVDPWMGFGVGYEWVSASGPETVHRAISLNGWQYAIVQLGADYKTMVPNLGIGPFVSFAFGGYSNETPIRTAGCHIPTGT